ncbi:adenylate kinase family protein [Mycoplasma sp. CSL7503-lung]|uniref:adenylate kinase family protein n=1 Tax=Mycoplasma sp. CSL7503-lung TaxID=536372 RepID=UPI0021D2ED29|nr:nucleoside monophosphate kinase [Mycoplasma sp. CSL7503-lung]MCU4706386.1 nucleoside monophosphate kinase [Mycoplasma sp. CSL7503-lung]
MITKNLIFMGQPGAGKGTVAELITKETNLVHLSTGNIFRTEIKNKTTLGLKVQEYVNSGGYVPDEITNEIVFNAISKLKNEGKYFILDGYPRTVQQAEYLKSLKEFEFDVVEIRVTQDVVLERLGGRRTCSKCGTGYHIKFKPSKVAGKCDLDGADLIIRNDDTEEKIVNRLKIYQEQTKPLLDYYIGMNELKVVDGSLTPEQVAKKVLGIL